MPRALSPLESKLILHLEWEKQPEVDAYGSRVMMARPEKTIVDDLDHPAYIGDIPEIAAMLRRGQGQLDWDRLADYALRFESQALVQRLGYLADLIDAPLEASARDHLLESVGKNTPYLGRTGQWDTGGEYDATWRVMDNIPRRELLISSHLLDGSFIGGNHVS